jgi:sigma-B regulation protein RsbU (phosphoserine phosphatase)
MTMPSQAPFPFGRERTRELALSADGANHLPHPANNNEAISSAVIAIRAYDKWMQRGRPHGTELQDWLEAEAELKEIKELALQLAETNAILQQALAESSRREEALERAEARYHSIFENAVEGIYQTTPEGQFLAVNPALAHMLGFDSPEELITGIRDIGRQLHVYPECRARFQQILRERGRVQGFECQLIRKDGQILWASLTARAVHDQSGALRFYEGTVVDVSARKQAETALKDSEALYHSLVETLPICIFRKDLEGRFTFGNQAFCSWLKQPFEQVVGKTDLDFYPDELAQKYIHDDRRVMETGEILEAIEEHQKPGEERTYVQVLKGPLRAACGEVIGMQGIFWDITPNKRAEAELGRTAAEFRIARCIQQKLFPIETPTVAGLDIAVRTFGFDISGASYPAEAIGGDYYDFIPLLDGSLGIAIGDVSGHGVGPALLMAEARALLRAFATTQADLSTILTLVNRVLVPDIEGDRFITLLLARLNPQTRSLRYASAGHQTGFLLGADGRVKQKLPSTGMPLGVLDETEFPSNDEIPLEPGDLLLLITDGILDARSPDGTSFGYQRALDIVRVFREEPARRIVDHLYYAVRAFSQSLPQYDDITAVVIRVHPNGESTWT